MLSGTGTLNLSYVRSCTSVYYPLSQLQCYCFTLAEVACCVADASNDRDPKTLCNYCCMCILPLAICVLPLAIRILPLAICILPLAICITP